MGSSFVRFEPSKHVGEVVTVRGTAYDGAGGALVQLDDGTPVYVIGLFDWSEDLVNGAVEVTGRLHRRGSRMPEAAAAGEPHRHGLGETFALQDASWRTIA
jgi:hypothetical protein